LQRELFQFEADFFKALSHPIRIGILENLRLEDRNVNELCQLLSLEGSAVSQQLAVLRAKNIVVGIKEGTKVTYSVRDPLIFQLLDGARQIFDNHLAETLSQWQEIKQEISKTRGE